MRTPNQQKQYEKVREAIAAIIFFRHYQIDDWRTFYLASSTIKTLCYSETDKILSLEGLGIIDTDQSIGEIPNPGVDATWRLGFFAGLIASDCAITKASFKRLIPKE